MQRIQRRQFWRLVLGTSGAVGVGIAASWGREGRDSPLPDSQLATPPTDGLQEVSRRSWAMGSEVSVTAIHADGQLAQRAVDAALGELNRVEQLLSLYRPDSQLCRLNCDGVLDRPHPDVVAVMRHAQSVSWRTGGAFDATVQPLWHLYAEAQRGGSVPDVAAIEAARQKVDWRRIILSPDRIELRGKGTAVTLNGIAQGFAADRVMAVLRRHGIRHALVNTGEIDARGGRTEQQPWTVGIQHPRRKDAYVNLARLRDRSLATSGDYATTFGDGYELHHIFDPKTGRSPESLASVSIAAPTACEADALSTAVFVLGRERGLRLVRSTPGADALVIFKDGRMLATDGFPAEV